MDEKQLLTTYGLPPAQEYLDDIRHLLKSELARESRESGSCNIESLKIGCLQLFSKGNLTDVLLIWKCKMVSDAAGFAIEVQLLCGAGLEATKKYLSTLQASEGQKALNYITECELAGDFNGFQPAQWVEEYLDYYSLR